MVDVVEVHHDEIKRPRKCYWLWFINISMFRLPPSTSIKLKEDTDLYVHNPSQSIIVKTNIFFKILQYVTK